MATYDDILTLAQDEASADPFRHGGAPVDEIRTPPWLESVRYACRGSSNMHGDLHDVGLVVCAMLEGYSIAGMAWLAVLMPMVANQAGNTGQQALAVG